MRPGGVKNIKEHAWFQSFDWSAKMGQELDPPYKPAAKSNNDVANFNSTEENTPNGYPHEDYASGWDSASATNGRAAGEGVCMATTSSPALLLWPLLPLALPSFSLSPLRRLPAGLGISPPPATKTLEGRHACVSHIAHLLDPSRGCIHRAVSPPRRP